MQYIGYIILFLLALVGCDPVDCATEYFHNKTSTSFYMIKHSSDSQLFEKVFVDQNSQYQTGEEVCALGGVIVNYSAYDSVSLENQDGNILKVYKPDDVGKTIFNLSYWTIQSTSKNSTDYTFEITDEDLK